MSRNRFRVQLEPRDELNPSVKSPSGDADAPSRTFESQIRIFSTKGRGDWVLRKQKARAPHPHRGTRAASSVVKQEKLPKDEISSSTSSGPKDVEEPESATQRRREGPRRNSASLTAEFSKTIPPSVMAHRRPSSSSSAANSILDDLRPHPHSLTIEEQNFVIKWLQFQATVSWSSNSTDLFCPCRDIAWRGIQKYPAGGLPWTLIFCDMYLAWSRRQPLPQRLHRRKAMAYKYIAKLLADPETQVSDEALLCVCLAMSIDARSLSPETNRVHLKGLAQMISNRGVGSLFSAVCFKFHPMFCLAYFAMAELEATSMLDVQSATQRFLKRLDSMQQDGRMSQSEAVRRRRNEDVAEDEVRKNVIDGGSRPYVSSSLWSVSMGKSTIHHAVESVLVDSRWGTLSIQQGLSLFLNLYLLNLILWDLVEWPDSAAIFLQKLSIHADNARVRLEICAWLLATSWVDADGVSKRPDGGAKKEVVLIEAVIDALKIFSRITDESKEKMIIVLSSWLFGCDEDDDGNGGGSESIDPVDKESSSPSMAKMVSSPPQQLHGHGAGTTSKVFKYLSSRDFKVMMGEACSEWYEKNVGKRPMLRVPMASTPPPPPQRQRQHEKESV